MHSHHFSTWQNGLLICWGLILSAVWIPNEVAGQNPIVPSLQVLTNILQLHRLANQQSHLICSLRLEGIVCAAIPAEGLLILHDDSGAELVQLNGKIAAVQPGQQVLLVVDNCMITTAAGTLRISKTPPPRLIVMAWTTVPPPKGMTVGQILGEDEDCQWAELEGTVTSVSKQSQGLEMDLRAGTGYMRVEVADSSGLSPELLLNSRIRVTGVCQSAFALNGQKVAGVLAVLSGKDITQLELDAELWNFHPLTAISNLLQTSFFTTAEPIAHVAGQVCSAGSERSFVLADETGKVRVETLQATQQTVGNRIEVLGKWSRVDTKIVLQSSFCRDVLSGTNQALTGQSNVLTTAEQIKRLKEEKALRGLPVKIRGVVTCIDPDYHGIVVQDSTLGVYVKYPATLIFDPPQVGDYCEIEGITEEGFAPMVCPQRVVRLGKGMLPVPVHPTGDQLLNGSMDTQYVEIEGVATEIQTNAILLLTRFGMIKIDLPGVPFVILASYENALISLRGCLFTVHIGISQGDEAFQMKYGEIGIHNASITVDNPAPEDIFDTPLKQAAKLLFYDFRASAFQRVKVSGQIVHERQGEYYLMDGSNGLRFIPKGDAKLQVSDKVEVVGFPELSGPSPLLREAVARKTGSAGLPSAKLLAPENLLRNENDSTLVRVDGLLVNLINNGTEQVLEMQAGVRRFVARVSGGGQFLKSIPFGSRLELTGVYAGQGGNLEIGGDVDSFELLLNSPADIRVLARPAWWTFGRLLALMAALACVLFLALIWISLLHRQVEQRTTQLKQEIHERESAEHRRDLEEERARIARDLHDDLGSSLTEISMLAETGRDQPPAAEDSRNRFDRILGRAHTLVRTLDEIVWAVDPRKDTLPALVHYLAGFAEEYVSAAGLACMVGTPEAIPEESFTAKERHQLFLAVKEALHNSVRHSHANKIIFYIGIAENKLNITITDDGCGFNPSLTAEGNGLTNLHERLVSLRGRCEINSSPEAGTTVSLSLPLSNISHSP